MLHMALTSFRQQEASPWCSFPTPSLPFSTSQFHTGPGWAIHRAVTPWSLTPILTPHILMARSSFCCTDEPQLRFTGEGVKTMALNYLHLRWVKPRSFCPQFCHWLIVHLWETNFILSVLHVSQLQNSHKLLYICVYTHTLLPLK